jgi:tripartite-type tricarboxylate transporter receptor subunit TctC
MFKFRRLRVSLAAVSAVALLAAACGTDDDDAAAPDTEEPDDADAPDEDEDVEEIDNPFEGEDITLTVGVSPGGGYDAYARMLAPEIAERWDADVVVNNEPGAGGLVALNNLLASEPDGTQIMLINGPGIGGSSLVGAEGADFQLDELTYVGRVSDAPRMVAAGVDSGYDSMEDLEDGDPFVIGATGPGASTYVEPLVLFEIMGWPYELVTGYDGSTETIAGMVAGEVEGVMLDVDTVGPTVQDGDAEALFIMAADESLDDFPDVPILAEQDLDEETQALADAAEALAFMGRTLVIHPDTDPEVANFIHDTFQEILTDPDFEEEAESQGRPLGYADQDEVDELVQTLLDAPERFFEILESGY